jgi:hypothetical protein
METLKIFFLEPKMEPKAKLFIDKSIKFNIFFWNQKWNQNGTKKRRRDRGSNPLPSNHKKGETICITIIIIYRITPLTIK